MRIVDEALFDIFEASGFYVPSIHEADPGWTPPPGTTPMYDGLVDADNSTNVVTYPLPYAVYYSSIGDDHDARLAGRKTRRSVFWSITYVGIDRNQAKWCGEKVRDAIQGVRPYIPGHKAWLIDVLESQRVRRDDEAVRSDGSPLFYGVDNYSVSITHTTY